MRILLISNSNARRGKEPLDPALDVFARAGISVVEQRAARGREVPALIRTRAGQFDAVVLAGGDGTVHDAAPALVEAGVPVGILPRGTANDLARAIGIPFDLTQAAEVIAAGFKRAIDIGEVNGKLFFNVAHIGLGAALADNLTGPMKRRLGPLAYTLAAAVALIRLRPFHADLVADGERHSLRTFAITVGNGRFFGGSGLVAEDAQIDDGVFHVFALTTKNPFRLIWMLPDLVRGRQGRSDTVLTVVTAGLEIRTVRPMRIRADGKLMADTPATFHVRPKALEVFAPVATSAVPPDADASE
jgi:YegS/Rv2252/BmrU family lipid kinase